MEITPIKTENDYEKALERLEVIFDAAPNSIEGDEAEILSILIDNYENQHFPIEVPDPFEKINIADAEKSPSMSLETFNKKWEQKKQQLQSLIP